MFTPKKQRGDWQAVDLASIGITLVLAIVIGYFAGRWIGQKLGNELVGSLIGFVVGTAAGFIEMFRTVSRWNKQQAAQDAKTTSEREEATKHDQR